MAVTESPTDLFIPPGVVVGDHLYESSPLRVPNDPGIILRGPENNRLTSNTVLYQVFLGSFNYEGDNPEKWLATIDEDDPDFLGGTIPGIITKLDYFVELGVDGLYISAFAKGVSYHGYHTTDLKDVDPNFGTKADLELLVELAHAKGLMVICDFVPNHVSNQHPYFLEARDNPDSPFRDWFIFDDSPEGYRKFLHFEELVKLNLDHPPAMEYVLDAARQLYDMKVDGLRLDHVIGLKPKHVEQLVGTLRREYPGRAFIGEALLGGVRPEHLDTLGFDDKEHIVGLHVSGQKDQARHLLYEQFAEAGHLHGLLNFAGTALLERYANSDDASEQRELRRQVIAQSQMYSGQLLLPTALDDHDRERALFRFGNSKERLKRAATLLATLAQPMIIYYGTEIAMTQTQPFSARPRHGDLLARQRMDWANPDLDMLQFYKDLIHSRKG